MNHDRTAGWSWHSLGARAGWLTSSDGRMSLAINRTIAPIKSIDQQFETGYKK